MTKPAIISTVLACAACFAAGFAVKDTVDRQDEAAKIEFEQQLTGDEEVFVFPQGVVYIDNGWTCVFTNARIDGNFCVPSNRIGIAPKKKKGS